MQSLRTRTTYVPLWNILLSSVFSKERGTQLCLGVWTTRSNPVYEQHIDSAP